MNGLLKFITCGSVDDGKSTLIGHILYDAKLLYADQEKALELASKVGSRAGKLDYSLLLDGLMAEREQGITIDVAYRYFTTDRRSFIVADTPGHEEYTRNMAVGASFADLAVILIDATQGVLVQTLRHTRICALMGISSFVFAINKMDLAGYDEAVYDSIRRQVLQLQADLKLRQAVIIPLSATEGDNVTVKSDKMPWYTGQPLLSYLETVNVDTHTEEEGFYLPVQRVSRPDHTFRGFQGQIESGVLSVGDEITALPSGEKAHVRDIYVAGVQQENAVKGQPVSVQLDREVDVSRGCVLARGTSPAITSCFTASLLWMDDESLQGSGDFLVKLGTKLIPGNISAIEYAIDVNSGSERQVSTLSKNELAVCEIQLSERAVMDTFAQHRTLGEVILIDRLTNATSACGIITAVGSDAPEEDSPVTSQKRAAQKKQTPWILLTDGIESARRMEKRLMRYGKHTMTADVPADRVRFAAQLLQQAGVITLIPFPVPADVLEGLPHVADLTDGESLPERVLLD